MKNRTNVLPARPNLEYLKKLAKQRVAALRKQGKTASLAGAQLALARSYGFPSWRKLKTHIEAQQQPAERQVPEQPGADSAAFENLMKAITDRDDQALARVLADAPAVVNQTGAHPRWGGRPQPLHVAIESDNAAAFELLLKAGANVNGENQSYDGWSPLMISIHSERQEMRDELIRRGVNIDLIAALMLGDDRRVAAMIRDPAVLNGPFPNNATPLHFARTVRSARLLLAIGVRIEAKDKYGKTALERWVSSKSSTAGLIRLAHSLGANPSDIFTLIEKGRLPEVRRFLSAGGDANMRSATEAQITLLHAAAFNGKLAIVKLLVAKGADLEARDREHNATPAEWARFALKAFNRKSCEAVAGYIEGLADA